LELRDDDEAGGASALSAAATLLDLLLLFLAGATSSSAARVDLDLERDMVGEATGTEASGSAVADLDDFKRGVRASLVPSASFLVEDFFLIATESADIVNFWF
jgi:hypothetical protein